VPVEKIPHDLCPVPQPDTTGKAAWHQQVIILRIRCLYGGGQPYKRRKHVMWMESQRHILRGCKTHRVGALM